MRQFVKIVNGTDQLTFFSKGFVLDVSIVFECTSRLCQLYLQKVLKVYLAKKSALVWSNNAVKFLDVNVTFKET